MSRTSATDIVCVSTTEMRHKKLELIELIHWAVCDCYERPETGITASTII